MPTEKVLMAIGFFFVNGLLIGSLFTGRAYLLEVILFSVVINLLYVGLLAFLRKSTQHIS